MEVKKALLLIISIQVLCTAIILSVLFFNQFETRLTKPGPEQAQGSLDFADLLFSQELYEAAAQEYDRVLVNYDLPEQKTANIAYKVGEIYLDKLARLDDAFSFFLKAENRNQEERLTKSINDRKVECLEKMKRSSDARRVLEESALLDPQDTSQPDATAVVAEIGDKKITVRNLENQMDRLPSEIREKIKTRDDKIEFLRQMVATELIYNAAKRKGFDRVPQLVDTLRQFEKNLLVQQFVSEELGDSIKITPSDLQLYHEANKKKYNDKPLEQVQQQVAQDYQMVKYQEALSLLFERLSAAEKVTLHPANIGD